MKTTSRPRWMLATSVAGAGLLLGANAQALTTPTDAGGYFITDSTSRPGLPITFNSIVGTGSTLHFPVPPAAVSDDQAAPVAVPGFAFPFYGSSFSSFQIFTNGGITAGANAQTFSTFSNTPIPNPSPTVGDILPYWDDLFFTAARGDSVRSQFFPGGFGPFRLPAFVVQWSGQYFFQTGDANVQAILLADGTIFYTYGNLQPRNGSSATIGVQNPTRTIATQYSFNQANAVSAGQYVIVCAPTSIFFGCGTTGASDGKIVRLGIERGLSTSIRTQNEAITNQVQARFGAPFMAAPLAFASMAGNGQAPFADYMADAPRRVPMAPPVMSDPRWSAWAAMDATYIERGADGEHYAFRGGLDYRLTPGFLLGAFFGAETLNVGSVNPLGASEPTVNGSVFSVGPYLGFRLTDTWTVDAHAAYGQSNYGTVGFADPVLAVFRRADIGDNARWSAAVNLVGNYDFGRIFVKPRVGVSYISEDVGTVVDQFGFPMVVGTVSLGRVVAGGTVGARLAETGGGARFDIHATALGEWDFDTDRFRFLLTGTSLRDRDELGLTLAGGITIASASDRLRLKIEASANHIDSQGVESYGGRAHLTVKF